MAGHCPERGGREGAIPVALGSSTANPNNHASQGATILLGSENKFCRRYLCCRIQPTLFSQHLALPQVANLLARQAQLAQDFVAMLAQLRRAAAEFGWGLRVAGGSAGLAK